MGRIVTTSAAVDLLSAWTRCATLFAVRLFFAIPVPADVGRELGPIRDDSLRGARWVDAPKLHLTMRFVGEVDDATLARLIGACAALPRWPRLELSLRGLGSFGGRVLFIVPDPIGPLRRIAEDLEAAVVAAGRPPEARAFAPHVTLARLNAVDRRALRALQQRHLGASTSAFAPPSVQLVKSTLGAAGARHEALLELVID